LLLEKILTKRKFEDKAEVAKKRKISNESDAVQDKKSISKIQLLQRNSSKSYFSKKNLQDKSNEEQENFQMKRISKEDNPKNFLQKKSSNSQVQHSNHFLGRRNLEELDEKKPKSTPRKENSERSSFPQKQNFGNWGSTQKNKTETTLNESPKNSHFMKKKTNTKEDPESEEEDNDLEIHEFEKFLNEETQTLFIAFKTREEAQQVQDLCKSHVDKSAIMKIRHLKVDKHQIPKEVLKQVQRQVEQELKLTGDTLIDFMTRESEINAKLTKLGYQY
jgi:hypothetical protein